MGTEVKSIVTTTYSPKYSDSLKPSVSDRIGLFSPQKTPFLAMLDNATAKQRKEEWVEDNLSPAGENAHVEGFDVVTSEGTAPDRFDNYTQIFQKDFSVYATAEVVDKYGRKGELARLRKLKTKELATDLEFAFLNGTRQAGTGSTPRKMDGAFAFVDKATDAYFDFEGNFADANIITEDILLDVMQGIWDAGCEPDTVLAPMNQKRKISAFTDKGRLTINQNATEKKITLSVRIIETDMGTVAIVAERFIKPEENADKQYDKLLVFQKDVFERLTLRPVKEESLAKTGDSDKRMLVTEQTLKCATKKGVGSIEKLSRVKAA